VDAKGQVDEAAPGEDALGRSDVDDIANLATVYGEAVSVWRAPLDGQR
jgi:hypothetical protein